MTKESKNPNTSLAFKNSTFAMGTRVINMFILFYLKTLFIRTLGIEYTGISTLFTDILTILSFAELGIGNAINFALYKPLIERDTKKIAQLMNFYKMAYIVIGIVVIIIGISIIPLLPFFVKDVPNIKENIVNIYLLYLFNTGISYFLVYRSSLLIANQESYKINIVEIISSIIKALLGSIALIIFKNFVLYLIIEISITLFGNILIYYKSSIEFPELKSNTEKLEKSEILNLLKDVSALALFQISNVVLKSTDSIIISSFINTALVGFLGNYRLIITSIDTIVKQITLAITPSIGHLAISHPKKMSESFYSLFFINYWITIATTIPLYFLLSPFIELWLGTEFLMGKTIIVLLIIDYFLVNIIRPVATFRTANGLFIQGKWRPLIMAILNIVLSLTLVNIIGIAGVLLGTIISRLITQVWFDPFIVYRHVLKEPYKNFILLLLRYLIVALVVFVSVYGLIDIVSIVFIQANQLVYFSMISLICIFVPTLLIWIIFKNKKEGEFAIDLIGKLKKRTGINK